MTRRPKLHVLARSATHFLRWERPHYARHFDLVDAPGPTVIAHGFGGDTLDELLSIPARSKTLYLRVGHERTSPLFDASERSRFIRATQEGIEVVFVNPGPLLETFSGCTGFEPTRYAVDTDRPIFDGPREAVESLVHISADYPQKDWRRSAEIMRRTGLFHEVFPPRGDGGASRSLRRSTKVKRKLNRRLRRIGVSAKFNVPRSRYVEHDVVLDKLRQFDGFVHVAAPTPPVIDSLYTATLIEAGLSGCILFWHNTHGSDTYLETVFDLPLEPAEAAERILGIAESTDIRAHSAATRAEMLDNFRLEVAVAERSRRIIELAS